MPPRLPRLARRMRAAHAVLLLVLLATTATAASAAGGKGGRKDTVPPSVSIAAPAAGATTLGTVTVSGAAADNVQVASVQVCVDGGACQPASGTNSWSFALRTTAYPDGTHTVTAKAADSSGKTATAAVSLTFKNTTPPPPPPPTPPPPPPPPPPPSDTAPPVVAFSAPAAASTVSGGVALAGTASDNAALAKVEISVDGGPFQAAQGTSNWSASLDTLSYANGSHTLSARATDTSGNVATASESVAFANAASLPPGVAEQLVTPEGATIQIYSDVNGWTARQISDLLRANALELASIGPRLTVKVQTTYASSNSVSVSETNGVYGNFRATIYLKAAAGTVFPARPDNVMAHEYGCVWAYYHLYFSHQGDWGPWLSARGILGDPRLDSSFSWSKNEMIADDYRILFGSPAAQSEAAYINPDVPDPRNVPGLLDFFLNVWAA